MVAPPFEFTVIDNSAIWRINSHAVPSCFRNVIYSGNNLNKRTTLVLQITPEVSILFIYKGKHTKTKFCLLLFSRIGNCYTKSLKLRSFVETNYQQSPRPRPRSQTHRHSHRPPTGPRSSTPRHRARHRLSSTTTTSTSSRH